MENDTTLAEVEELESREAPGWTNHNETMLEDVAEIEELESREAPDTRINHNETMLEDVLEISASTF